MIDETKLIEKSKHKKSISSGKLPGALNLPDCCKNCPNRPSKQNGYTSICLCALPALTNPITV